MKSTPRNVPEERRSHILIYRLWELQVLYGNVPKLNMVTAFFLGCYPEECSYQLLRGRNLKQRMLHLELNLSISGSEWKAESIIPSLRCHYPWIHGLRSANRHLRKFRTNIFHKLIISHPNVFKHRIRTVKHNLFIIVVEFTWATCFDLV